MTLRALAHAKVNLHLEVLARRPDGYHEIETVFQSIELHDQLEFTLTEGPIYIECDHPGVPVDRSNLCHRAAKLLRTRLGIEKGVHIKLQKSIPVAAGLGGGSADAAACLRALPRLWWVDVDDDLLHELAATLGADVPFFLRGGTQLGRGIGTDLKPLVGSGEGWYLVLTPQLELSTTWVYEHFRMGLTPNIPKVNLQNYKALLARFPERRWPGINRLSDVVFPAHPSLHRLYLELLETRPQIALMSGSGPSLFAVYSDESSARDARERFVPTVSFTWVGRSVRRGVTVLEG